MDLVRAENTYAVIVAIEEYQFRIKNVDYATNDARAFYEWLHDDLGVPADNITLWMNSQATQSALINELRYQLRNLTEDDRFIFYYAGHGFHDGGYNRITAWDSYPASLRETTVCLNEILLQPLRDSPCTKSLIFIDSCSSFLDELEIGRDMLADMHNDEFIDFVRSSNYQAMFTSCSRGEKSYGSQTLRHGIWTHFLLQALKGEAREALERERFVTSTSLQNYLRHIVPRYIRERTEIRGTQTPWACISSNNTFAIHEIPVEEGEFEAPLAGLQLQQDEMFFRKVETSPIQRLPGFNRRTHFIPDRINRRVDDFIASLLQPSIEEELETIYANCRDILGLRRREITKTLGTGNGNIDTSLFRFQIDTKQNPEDPAESMVDRRLVLLIEATAIPEGLERVFPVMPNEIVIPIDGDLNYDDLVDKFEDVKDANGGTLDDNDRTGLIEYTAPDGVVFIISAFEQELVIKPRATASFANMLAAASTSFAALANAEQRLLE